MGLEYWDADRKKYVLYRSEAEHSLDCARFPLEKIPRRMFVDTNVINLLVKYACHIFEGVPIPKDIDHTRAMDIEALMHVCYVWARADSWDVVSSRKALEEIAQTKCEELRDGLMEYAQGFVSIDDRGLFAADDFARRLSETEFVAVLPDVADRALIGNAIGLDCDGFCTCDRSTIISKRDQLRQMHLRIVTPAEWWAHIKPWAALWT